MPRSPIRLFMNTPLYAENEIIPENNQAHYLITVMRLGVGDTIEVFNGRDGAWFATLKTVHRKQCTLVVTQQRAAQINPPDVWLCIAPLKKGRIDWSAEKACELGMRRFQLIRTERSVVERINYDRLRAHMIEAAEQCGHTFVPEVPSLQTLDRLLHDWPAERAILFCDETSTTPALENLRSAPAGAWAIFIGPEGGFTQAERDRFIAMPQTHAISLGPRLLRADTAAAAAMTLWQAALGDWGGQ